MASKLLAGLFRSVEFPAPIANLAVAAYANVYADDLAKNKTLGDAAAPLVAYNLVYSSRVALVRGISPAVLSAVLDSNEDHESVLREIPVKWSLSQKDQLRFVRRPASEHFLLVTAMSPDFSSETHNLAASLLREQGFHGTVLTRSSEPPKVSSPRMYPQRYEYVHTGTHRKLMPTYTVVGMIEKSDNGSLRFISPILTEQLGHGLTPRSIRSWELFFGLLDGDPDVPVQTVLDTAKQLARAEDAG